MTELTLEALAARVAALETEIAAIKSSPMTRTNDWRSVVGIMPDDEFTRAWIAEMEAIREADRAAARNASDAEGSAA